MAELMAHAEQPARRDTQPSMPGGIRASGATRSVGDAGHGTEITLSPWLGPAQVAALQRRAGNSAVAKTIGVRPSYGARCGSLQRDVPESRSATNATVVSVQRDVIDDITTTSVDPEALKRLDDAQLDDALRKVRDAISSKPGDAGLQGNLRTALAVKSSKKLQSLAEAGEEVDPASPGFDAWSASLAELTAAGGQPLEDPPVVAIPGDRLIGVDEAGQVALLDPADVVQPDDTLLDQLDKLASAAAGDGDFPTGPRMQILIWPDGRTLTTPPMTAGFAELVLAGEPDDLTEIVQVTPRTPSWRDVAGPGAGAALGSGIFQLGTFPISNFRGVPLAPGSRIRFASPGFGSGWRWGPPPDTRFLTIYRPGTNKFYAWDAHAPVGNTPHDFWHVNQKGMAQLFQTTDHAPIPPAALGAAKGLRYAKLGSRVFLIVGVAIDAALLTESAIQSVERGTPKPIVAQAIRTIGGWAGAWVGAKAFCVGGAAATIETGPGRCWAVLPGGWLAVSSDTWGSWVADMIEAD